ncbi:ADP-ribose pyrophosphatase, mitochondrial [Drosophila navojoa]|nr:ADP-ribose pyrophosphatase, mitochondrial [Drosophila navojoa]
MTSRLRLFIAISIFLRFSHILANKGMLASIVKPGTFRHIMCRNNVYPRSNVTRFSVPDDLVFWNVPYESYCPTCYTAPHINGQTWADEPLPFEVKWNQNDGLVNRVSFHGEYKIKNGLPQNPIGRTGLCGRGLLGRWGPNHAADPIVTRWKRDENGEVVSHENSGKNILQMVAIQRSDNKMWAIPGGMVDPGENVSVTLKREFTEEALNFDDKGNMVEQFFKQNGEHVYSGYVDDFRNTDNSWMETTALNFHDDDGSKVGQLQLQAGDDATNVRWTDISGDIKLHANHADIVREVAVKRNAHW